MRRLRLITPIPLTLALVLAACGGDQPSGSADGSTGESAAPAESDGGGGTATGGTVRIGIGGYTDSLNPGNGVLSLK